MSSEILELESEKIMREGAKNERYNLIKRALNIGKTPEQLILKYGFNEDDIKHVLHMQ